MTHILLHMKYVIQYKVVNQCMLPRRRLGQARNGTNSASNMVCDTVYSCKSVYAAEEKIRAGKKWHKFFFKYGM